MLKGNYFVYITTNPGKTVLYTGMTCDPFSRMQQHFDNRGDKETFAGKYYCYKLVYYERYSDVKKAIEREKEIKYLSRNEKEKLINLVNPGWRTLNIIDFGNFEKHLSTWEPSTTKPQDPFLMTEGEINF